MAGLDPATQQARARAPQKSKKQSRGAAEDDHSASSACHRFAPADAGALGGRVKPGHGEFLR